MLVQERPDAAASVKCRASQFGLMPALVPDVLAIYPERSTAWLVDVELHPLDQAQVDLRAKAILEAVSDEHREATVKCLRIGSAQPSSSAAMR